jgi:3-hydroxyacyl-CoA dehydrogenase
MGNAIGWLALEGGYDVVAHVPTAQFAAGVPRSSRRSTAARSRRALMSQADVDAKLARAKVTTDVADLVDCDLVIEARMENARSRPSSTARSRRRHEARRAGRLELELDGPGPARRDFVAGGGSTKNFVNLHFFSPAEHPMMQLVEVIAGKDTTPDAVATRTRSCAASTRRRSFCSDGSPAFS